GLRKAYMQKYAPKAAATDQSGTQKSRRAEVQTSSRPWSRFTSTPRISDGLRAPHRPGSAYFRRASLHQPICADHVLLREDFMIAAWWTLNQMRGSRPRFRGCITDAEVDRRHEAHRAGQRMCEAWRVNTKLEVENLMRIGLLADIHEDVEGL